MLFPSFLEIREERHEMPGPDQYSKTIDEETGKEIINDLFIGYIDEYEKTQL
jgi:hypothetical protein